MQIVLLAGFHGNQVVKSRKNKRAMRPKSLIWVNRLKVKLII